MNGLGDLYLVLEQMLDYARQDNSWKVLELNTSFDSLLLNSFYYNTAIGSNYDNCRQSCVMAGRMRGMRQDFLDDAIKRFSLISKHLK